jgi:hypothetical protein
VSVLKAGLKAGEARWVVFGHQVLHLSLVEIDVRRKRKQNEVNKISGQKREK